MNKFVSRVKMVSKQSDMKDVLVDGKYFATAIKVEGGVTLDHVQPDDNTMFDVTKADGSLIKTWKDTEYFIYDLINEMEQ